MGFSLKGQIVQILPVQSGTSQRGNQWQRASYIVEHESGQYPKRMVFDVRDAKIQELNLQMGEWVTLHFNCDCREYPQGSGKFFNSIEAWKVERQGQYQQAPMQQGYQQSMYQQPMQQGYQPQQGYQQMPQQAPVQQPMQQVAPTPFPPQQPAAQPAPQAQAPQQQGLPFPPPPAQ